MTLARYKILSISLLAVLGLQGCENQMSSSQVVCWTDSASPAFQASASGIHRYASAYADLVCVPLVTRRLTTGVGGEAGAGSAARPGGGVSPAAPRRESIRLAGDHGTMVDRDRGLEASVVPSAVNPGTSLMAMETDQTLTDANTMLNDLFQQHGMTRTVE